MCTVDEWEQMKREKRQNRIDLAITFVLCIVMLVVMMAILIYA